MPHPQGPWSRTGVPSLRSQLPARRQVHPASMWPRAPGAGSERAERLSDLQLAGLALGGTSRHPAVYQPSQPTRILISGRGRFVSAAPRRPRPALLKRRRDARAGLRPPIMPTQQARHLSELCTATCSSYRLHDLLAALPGRDRFAKGSERGAGASLGAGAACPAAAFPLAYACLFDALVLFKPAVRPVERRQKG